MYVYKVTHIPTGQFYYGSRTATREIDLWTRYFTSSKTVKQLIEQNGVNSFVAEVISSHDTKDEALDAENSLIREHISNPMCINKSYSKEGKRFFSTTGRKHTEAAKAKISAAHKGRSNTWVAPSCEVFDFRNGDARLNGTRKDLEAKGLTSQEVYNLVSRRVRVSKGWAVLTPDGWSDDRPSGRSFSYAHTKKTCEHCGKTCSAPNFTRWHGEKCRALRSEP